MKKGMLFIVALLTVAQATAYQLTIHNRSKKQVELQVSYRKKRCPMSVIKLKPGQKKVHKHGLCCIAGLTLIPRSGTGPKGPFGPYDAPKLTGLGYSCTSNKIRIVDIDDGTLMVEAEKEKTRGQYIFVKNMTSYPLQLKIKYGAAGVCPIEYARVASQGTLIHKTGRGSGVYPGALIRCCATTILVRATRGPDLAQKWHTFEPKRTGIIRRQSCRDNSINVEKNPDGSLHLEGK